MQPQDPQRQPYYPPREQPVYRFPQNRPNQGWQPQQSFQHAALASENLPEERRERHKPRKRRRIFTWWNLFALIGIGTVLVQAARYLVIPLLVYLKVLTGGAL